MKRRYYLGDMEYVGKHTTFTELDLKETFKDVHATLTDIYLKLSTMKNEMEDLEKKVIELEENIEDIHTRLDAFIEIQDKLEQSVKALDSRTRKLIE